MSKRTKVVLAVIGLLLAIQLFRPSRTNPTIDSTQEIAAVLKVNPGVQAILNRSCQDCHSNRTVWPGYSEVAPISWLVADDVNSGRRHMNFSEWGTYPSYKQQDLLNEMCKIVTQRDMPPFTYGLAHAPSRPSEAEREAICEWTKAAGVEIAVPQGEAPRTSR